MPMPTPTSPARAAPASMSRHDTAWLLGGLALWLLATLWVRPLMLPDEGRYVGVAYAMLHGDALVPRLHGLPYFHKPPLMYWIDAVAMALFGVHEAAARLAPAIGAWLMGAAIFLDLRSRLGLREAAIALGVLATTPFFFIGGQFANLDMLVAGLVTAAIVLGARSVEAPDARSARRAAMAAWAFAGLAVLAKGLIGIVLPGLVLLPWLLAQRRARAVLRLLDPLALGVAALIVLPWFTAMALRFPGFLDYFFLEQHVRRYAQSGFNNVQPFWFFAPVMLLLTLPWSPWLIDWMSASLRPHLRTTNAPDAPVALYAWWVVAVLAFFSLPQSKLVGYALPALGPFGALAGLAVARGRAWRWLLPASALGCVAVVAGIAWHDDGSVRELARTLRAQRQAGERVVLVADAHFDVPFYARLDDAPLVLLDWDDPSIAHRDDWRKELHDAARFDPAAAARVLVKPAELAQAVCGQRAVWFVAPAAWQPPEAIGPARQVHVSARASLWQATAPRSACR
ncbi:MAG: glycosyltransferase family 39 protein [Burkholderiaceae bacterium]|nr:MAG: glycosyltransferase family 39 protein [Burkholderiaceae bacterium]